MKPPEMRKVECGVRKDSARGGWPVLALFCLGTLLFFCGCTFARSGKDKAAAKHDGNAAALNEESRALTSAAKDALDFAPTNPPVTLAKQFLARDQQIEGLPVERIDVAALLAGNAAAVKLLEQRFAAQDELLRDRAELQVKLTAANERLQEMGRLYEAEKNKSVVRRVWAWLTGIFGIGGLIALVVLCPAVLPLFGTLASWLIGKVPALVNLFGFVGKRAFDSVVTGVGNVRSKLKIQEELPADKQPTYTAAEVRRMLDVELKEATEVGDVNLKPLITQRRKALNV